MGTMTTSPSLPAPVMPGTAAYRRIGIALFLAGFSTFALLYCAQPLLPVFAVYFQVSAAESSLALSVATFALAGAILCAAPLAEGFGRREVIFASMLCSAVLTLAGAFAPGWISLLASRALAGVLMGGMPAVAMTYLAEEIDPRGLGLATGLLVSGNAFGGMVGRVLTGILAESFSWRVALASLGVIGLAAAIGFVLLLPPSRRFTPRPGFEPAYHLRAWLGHVRDPALLPLFAISFLGMGAFVCLYNYVGFRLVAAPYLLNQRQIGLIFMVYLFGITASSVAGALADRLGRGSVLGAGLLMMIGGVALSLASGLPGIILGIVFITAGFFAAHSVASSWIGRLAVSHKGHASSLYLLNYYLGASIVGSAGGWFWSAQGWSGVAGFTAALLALALLAALRVALVVPRQARGKASTNSPANSAETSAL
jgi:YNFM family putative membrane transporter